MIMSDVLPSVQLQNASTHKIAACHQYKSLVSQSHTNAQCFTDAGAAAVPVSQTLTAEDCQRVSNSRVRQKLDLKIAAALICWEHAGSSTLAFPLAAQLSFCSYCVKSARARTRRQSSDRWKKLMYMQVSHLAVFSLTGTRGLPCELDNVLAGPARCQTSQIGSAENTPAVPLQPAEPVIVHRP